MKLAWTEALLLVFFGGCSVLTVLASRAYPGEVLVYLLFSLAVNGLLYCGLRRDSMFFDLFIGTLFWLGYWLKFSVRLTFFDGRFHESTGDFDFSGPAYDRALIVVTVGILGLLVARILRATLIFKYPASESQGSPGGLPTYYERHRRVVWATALLLSGAVALANAYFGIYQRGLAPRTVLPFHLGGVLTWYLLFGGASISALMLDMELRLFKRVARAVIVIGAWDITWGAPGIVIAILETFLSNLSMVSRGMILNAGVLIAGLFVALRVYDVSWKRGRLLLACGLACALFAASIFLVNYVRQQQFYGDLITTTAPDVGRLSADTKILFLDRWVGMEGAMAVSSYSHLGWPLLERVWKERFRNVGSGIYDREISKGISDEREKWLVENNVHFITIPGILAFFFYPGSYSFLFIAMMLVGGFGAAVEILTYRLAGHNRILCALLAFVIAYRYAHFGYAPAHSYLLLASIVLNVAIIYLADKWLRGRYRHAYG